MYTLRYTREAPIYPRPHAPTVPKFVSLVEAIEHLEAQPAELMLEVVER